jgi:peptidylprolyl isomerase
MENIKAKAGDLVVVHYTGAFDSGQVFDSSYDRGEPLELTIGQTATISQFNEAIIGMQIGEEKEIKITPENAYGDIKDELYRIIEPENLKAETEPAPGQPIQIEIGGKIFTAVVHSITDDGIILNFNHPLAGRNLNFKIELMAIEDAPDLGNGDQLG